MFSRSNDEAQRSAVDYITYTMIAGTFASVLMLVFLMFVIGGTYDVTAQGIAGLGIFGWLCGVTGTIMPAMTDLKEYINGSKTISIAFLGVASIISLVVSLAWMPDATGYAFGEAVVTILYFFATICRMKAARHEISDDFEQD